MKSNTKDNFWRQFLRDRQAWLQMVSDGKGASLNDADLAAISGLCHCANIPLIEVVDTNLCLALTLLFGRDEPVCPHLQIVAREVAGEITNNTAVCLMSFSEAMSAMAHEKGSDEFPQSLILVYGWNQGWSPASLPLGEWANDTLFLPLCHVSPSLWRSDLQLLTRSPLIEDVRKLIDALANLFNDGDLDVLMLLDRIQVLESTSRGRVSERPRRLEERATDRSETIQRLQDELKDAGRTIALQRSIIATAFTALGG